MTYLAGDLIGNGVSEVSIISARSDPDLMGELVLEELLPPLEEVLSSLPLLLTCHLKYVCRMRQGMKT